MNLLKKLIPFCFLIVFCDTIMWAQCPDEDIHLETQAEVNQFAALYPNCTQFTEDLRIGRDLAGSISTDITDLSPLNQITLIEGDLDIHFNSDLPDLSGLNNLSSVGRNFVISRSSSLVNLNALSSLTSIGRSLFLDFNSSLTNLNGLENLTSVRGISVSFHNDLTDISALLNVSSLEADLSITNNDNLMSLTGLDNIASIGGSLFIRFNDDNLTDLSGLENLTSVGEWVEIEGNDNLESLNNLNSLTSVGNNFYIQDNDNLTDLSGLENLISIGGQLLITDNSGLKNLSGLDNLASVGTDLVISDNSDLMDISALYKITLVTRDLTIVNSPNLTNLIGLHNLISVEERVSISNNSGLTSLTGLDNLTFIGGDVTINDNNNLLSLLGLQNVILEGETLTILDNPMLSVCNLPFVCNRIENNEFFVLGGNADGCDTKLEIIDTCPSIPKVYTNVFYDINQNEIQDNNEPDYHDAAIFIEPINGFYYSNDSGVFYLSVGSYTATLDQTNLSYWQLTTDATSYSFNLGQGDTETITFGIYPTQQISDIQPIINTPPARCNETIILDVNTKNLGTTIASGTMWLTTDDESSVAAFIHQPDTTIANTNTYGWYFSDLFPSQSVEKQVNIQVPGPPDFMLGDSLVFDAYADFEDANGSQSTQPFIYETEVRCSFDPNDKLINPNREGDYVLFEENLIYTIRFQNTGNDVAYDVVIRDTLDANLDLSTFRVLGSSHANRLNTILNDDEGVLTFEFRNIFLPDSTSNFEASQGYVNYLIRTIDGLVEETPVTNSAGIYFDLNPPIITNTTQSIMVSELPAVSTETPDNSFNFNILPNPNTGTFTVQGITNGTYQIHNTSGQIIRQGDMQNDMLIDISREAQGVYFISVTIDDATSIRRIVKM